MRVSTSLINHNNTSSILKKQTELFYTSQQLGTGKRVLTPSDDPVASTLAFNAKNKLANINQYSKNIDYAEKSLRTSEATLDSIHNRLSRARQLMIQAGNDAIGDAGRKTIGIEMREITDQLEKLINTKDEQGNYIFSGSKVDTAPYSKKSDGSYSYQGDAKEREVQISESVSTPLNMSGKQIFEDIASTHEIKSYAMDGNSTTNTIGTVSGTHAFLDGNQIGDYSVEITAAGIDIFGPRGQVIANNAADLSALETYLNAGADNSVGNLDLDDAVATAAAVGDKFIIRANNEKQDVLTGMQRFAEALESYTDQPHQRDILETSLDDLDSWLNSVEVARTEHGTRRNGIEAIASNNENVQIFLKEQVSNLEDLDYASAIGQFSLEQTALQASQQTFSKISALSLFNYIG